MAENTADLELLCILDGCTRKRYGRMDICEAHNYRRRRYGDPLGGKYEHKTPRGDFDGKYDSSGGPGACWPWLAARNLDGYGQWKVPNGPQIGAHVEAYTRAYGPVPEGLEIDHSCHNRACVNPSHMDAVTHQTNLQRRRPWKQKQSA